MPSEGTKVSFDGGGEGGGVQAKWEALQAEDTGKTLDTLRDGEAGA